MLRSFEDAGRDSPDLVGAALEQMAAAFAPADSAGWRESAEHRPIVGQFLHVAPGDRLRQAVTLDSDSAGRLAPRELALVVLEPHARAEILDGCAAPRHFGFERRRHLLVVIAEGAELVVTTVRHASGGAIHDTGFALVGTGARLVWRDAALTTGGGGIVVIERTTRNAAGARVEWTGLAATDSGMTSAAGGALASRGTAHVRATASAGPPSAASVAGPHPDYRFTCTEASDFDTVFEGLGASLSAFPGVMRIELVEVLRLMHEGALG